jgi:hypothetical protein
MGYAIGANDLRQGVVGTAFDTDFPAGSAPQVLNGAAITMNRVEPGTLSAHVKTLAQSTSLTIFGNWQVSADGTTYYDVKPVNNAALVALSTGTAGADTAVNTILPAPDAVYAWPYARLQLYSAAASTTTGDQGGIKYYYRENNL